MSCLFKEYRSKKAGSVGGLLKNIHESGLFASCPIRVREYMRFVESL